MLQADSTCSMAITAEENGRTDGTQKDRSARRHRRPPYSGWLPAAAAPAASNQRRQRRHKKVSSIKLVAAEYSADHTKAFWDQFATAYKQKYGITLDVQIISWNDIAQQSTTMVQNDNPPDILNINYYSSYAKDNLLYSADDVLPASVQSDLLDSFKTSGTFNGKLYGFPDLSSARALFYNKTLFSQAGISAPPKTWDEFEADAKKVQALGNGVVGYAEPLGPGGGAGRVLDLDVQQRRRLEGRQRQLDHQLRQERPDAARS